MCLKVRQCVLRCVNVSEGVSMCLKVWPKVCLFSQGSNPSSEDSIFEMALCS